LGRIAIDKARLDGEADEVESEELVLIFLGAAEDFFEEIPAGRLVARGGDASLATPGRDGVQEDELGAKMTSEGSGLVKNGKPGVGEIDGEKDFFESQHGPPGEEKDTIKIRV
jgi:hypothetical protein